MRRTDPEFKARLKSWRSGKGVTQKVAAKRCLVSPEQYYKWERGIGPADGWRKLLEKYVVRTPKGGRAVRLG